MSFGSTTIECPRCGQLNPAASLRCGSCGTALGTRAEPSARNGGASAGHRSAHLAAHAPRTRRWDTDTPEELYPVATRGGGPSFGRGNSGRKRTRRRLSRTPVIVGVTLLLVGLLVIVGVYAVNAKPRTLFLPSGNSWSLTPGTLTETTVFVKWFGGTASTRIFLVWAKPDCFGPTGVVVGGTGASGVLTAHLDPGTTYSVYACTAQASESMNFTVSFSGGITLSEVGGGFLVGIGVGLMAIGLRGRTAALQKRR